MLKRFCGGVLMMENSRKPSMAMLKVRGMGVAVRVKTSTSARKALSCSFCRTPKRCSSSRMTKPRFLNLTSFCIKRWVPIMMSMPPASKPAKASFCSLAVLKREISAILMGHALKRSLKLLKCCSASKVVGTNTATWRPPMTATKAARRATSVLPKPTSPQTKRSMGRPDCMSLMTFSIASN